MHSYQIKQYGKIFVVFALLLAFALLPPVTGIFGENSIIITSAVIGLSPLTLFETWNVIKSPHLVVTSVDALRLPKVVIDFESDTFSAFANSVCLRPTVKNVGFETAKSCEGEVFEVNSGRSTIARWSRVDDPVTIDLAAGEEQQIDMMWLDINTNKIQLPLPIDKDSEGGGYRRLHPVEIQAQGYANLKLRVRAKNMGEKPWKSNLMAMIGLGYPMN